MNSYSTSWWSLLLINRPREDERQSWPCWLTYSGRLTHKVIIRPASSQAQDRESSSVKDQRSTTVLRRQLRWWLSSWFMNDFYFNIWFDSSLYLTLIELKFRGGSNSYFSFHVAAPVVWNALPVPPFNIHQSRTIRPELGWKPISSTKPTTSSENILFKSVL